MSPHPEPQFHYLMRMALKGNAPAVMLGLDAEELAGIYDPAQQAILTSGLPLLCGDVIHIDTQAFIMARLHEAMLHPDALTPPPRPSDTVEGAPV